MKNKLTFLFLLCMVFSLQAQVDVKPESEYQFTMVKDIERTDIKSQDKTGTCWSFATSSYLESELIRSGKGPHNLSEMFVVKNIYKDKARNYVLRQGKANFSQGSLSHDVIRAVRKHGLVPEEAFSGLQASEKKHNHAELAAAMKGMLDGILKQKRMSPKWPKALEAILDVYMGETPEEFTYKGIRYTPQSFASEMGLDVDQYYSFSSYTHHPFYKPFVLEIPDNYSNGSFYNVPIDELQLIVDRALDQGYSIAWDGDVSEKGFSAKKGIAVLPKDAAREDLFIQPGEELKVDQALRQETFESFATTDDHLMHIVGSAKDQKGTKYYLIKNSWGQISPHKGYLYMSEAYFRLKTVAVMVHKKVIPADVAQKMSL